MTMATGDEIMEEIADAYEADFQDRKVGAAINFARDHGPIAAAYQNDEDARQKVRWLFDKYLKQSGLKVVNKTK